MQVGAGPPFQNPPACRGRCGRLRRLPSGLDAGPGDPGKTDSDARAKPLLQATPSLLSSHPFVVRQAWQGEADVPFRRGGPVGRPTGWPAEGAAPETAELPPRFRAIVGGMAQDTAKPKKTEAIGRAVPAERS